MHFDYSKLRGRIIEKFGSCDAFSNAAGWNPIKTSRILTNKHKMFTEDMEKFVDLLEIDAADIKAYFFTRKV